MHMSVSAAVSIAIAVAATMPVSGKRENKE